MGNEQLTPLVWVGSSKRDLMTFPEDVVHGIGLALMRAQYGDKPPSAKPLHGFGGAGVLELIEDEDGKAYRAVYTVKIRGRIYVLHAFQKKSKRGSETPKTDMEMIHKRLRQAVELHKEWETNEKEKQADRTRNQQR
jgi:phage-related protein